MTNIHDIALKIEKAWDEKDEATMRENLHPDYVSIDPMMTLKGVDSVVEKMKAFPFEGDMEIINTLTQGDIHVLQGVWQVESPFKLDIPYVAVKKFEGDKLKQQNIYFDTGRLPKKG